MIKLVIEEKEENKKRISKSSYITIYDDDREIAFLRGYFYYEDLEVISLNDRISRIATNVIFKNDNMIIERK